MTAVRGSYAGVLSILRYNWRAYVLSAGVLFAIAALLCFVLCRWLFKALADIYHPLEMTEPSIAAARQAHLAAQPVAQACKLDALPVPDGDRNTIFLLFAAHEIRQPDRRVDFFREAARVLSNSGQLLLVEHLRDWKTFLVRCFLLSKSAR